MYKIKMILPVYTRKLLESYHFNRSFAYIKVEIRLRYPTNS